MGGTFKTQNLKILSTQLSVKYQIDREKCHQVCSMVKFVEKNRINSGFEHDKPISRQ
jgi:hypothetical protein